jgi:hypothetical protein
MITRQKLSKNPERPLQQSHGRQLQKCLTELAERLFRLNAWHGRNPDCMR